MALLSQLLPVFYAIVSPVITEAVKDLSEKIHATVPANVVPIIGGVVGTIAGALTQAFEPSSTLNPESGMLAGLAGTGIHQALFGSKYVKKEK